MAWSWMVVGSGWTSPLLKDLTHQPLESTWVGPHMAVVGVAVAAAVAEAEAEAEAVGVAGVAVEVVEVVQVVLDAILGILGTMTVDMTAGTTVDTIEVAVNAMTTGTTTDHTEGALRPLTTEGRTGLGPDRDPILLVAIERCCEARPTPTQEQEVFLRVE